MIQGFLTQCVRAPIVKRHESRPRAIQRRMWNVPHGITSCITLPHVMRLMAGVAAAIDDPAIRIVSLTVTENGYCRNAATRTIDRDHPSIAHDLAHPDLPRSAIGISVEACRRRMAARAPAFTALTCDKIQHNGTVLRDAVLALATWRDQALADWIAANASFPSTMVDRITPVTTPAQVEDFTARFGLVDCWPIFCERLRQ